MPDNLTAVLRRKGIQIVAREGQEHLVSESYFYKTEAYYTLVTSELEGKDIIPSSREVVEAFVVPVCLMKAEMAGIPVCAWEISYAYAPVPSILYGINYFSDPADYIILNNPDTSGALITHITNKLKYPFCYQKIEDPAQVMNTLCVFGNVAGNDPDLASIAEKIYRCFRIPLFTMVLVRQDEGYLLSSLTSFKFAKLSIRERQLIRDVIREGACG
ncbi:MAG: RimK-like ATPgrasp N-terminal domain-containing protein [Methanomicrobiales archaeon]|nr:RimK-like ATPgrasp N-terminal domain-containing protein [Methanomicrobiales archaeon]